MILNNVKNLGDEYVALRLSEILYGFGHAVYPRGSMWVLSNEGISLPPMAEKLDSKTWRLYNIGKVEKFMPEVLVELLQREQPMLVVKSGNKYSAGDKAVKNPVKASQYVSPRVALSKENGKELTLLKRAMSDYLSKT